MKFHDLAVGKECKQNLTDRMNSSELVMPPFHSSMIYAMAKDLALFRNYKGRHHNKRYKKAEEKEMQISSISDILKEPNHSTEKTIDNML
jgi:hypothetical protein